MSIYHWSMSQRSNRFGPFRFIQTMITGLQVPGSIETFLHHQYWGAVFDQRFLLNGFSIHWINQKYLFGQIPLAIWLCSWSPLWSWSHHCWTDLCFHHQLPGFIDFTTIVVIMCNCVRSLVFVCFDNFLSFQIFFLQTFCLWLTAHIQVTVV